MPHGEMLSSGNDDLTDAYKMANDQVTKGQIILSRGYTVTLEAKNHHDIRELQA
jgi:hypothetical protein